MKPDYSAARTYALAQGPAGYGTRWNRGSGQHTVATVPGQSPVLMLAVTAVLDQMAHEEG